MFLGDLDVVSRNTCSLFKEGQCGSIPCLGYLHHCLASSP